MLWLREEGIAGGQGKGCFAGFGQEVEVSQEMGHAEVRKAGLLGSEEVARPADGQVLFGDLESIGGLFHHPEAPLGVFRPAVLSDEQALGGVFAPAYAAAKLVELGEAKPLGMLNHH